MLLRQNLSLIFLLLLAPAGAVSAQQNAAYGVGAPAALAAPISESARTLELRGDLQMARGSYAEALETFQQVEPRTAVVWNKIGIAYHHLFALDQAQAGYQRAVTLDPHYAEAYNNLGAVFYGRRQYGAAEKAYKRSLKYHPSAAGTYSNLGTLYFAESKWKKGVAAYQRALQMDPDVFNTARRQKIEEPASREQRMATDFYLAEVYATAGKSDEALACLRRALGDGFSDRKRLMQDRELASLRGLPEFHQMMVEGHLE